MAIVQPWRMYQRPKSEYIYVYGVNEALMQCAKHQHSSTHRPCVYRGYQMLSVLLTSLRFDCVISSVRQRERTLPSLNPTSSWIAMTASAPAAKQAADFWNPFSSPFSFSDIFRNDTHKAFWLPTQFLISTPVALTVSAEMGIGCPLTSAVRLMSSFSIRSRVVLVSSSTSAGVRPVVGMGSSTKKTCQLPYPAQSMSKGEGYLSWVWNPT